MNTTQSELTLKNLVEERETIRGQHEAKLAEIATREDKNATHADKEQLRGLRERAEDKDTEINDLTAFVEREKASIEASKNIRKILSGANADVAVDGDGVVYRTMAAYARDVILTRDSTIASRIAAQVGDSEEIQRARERLQLLRTPANTLSGNVGGLQPPQFIDQIFQVINKSRPIVSQAQRTTLNRGTLTYPYVSQRPIVAVQASEKTEGGNQGMVVSLQSITADTYLGGGDLSWQAIQWSTPDALQLWFDLCAADYALKTETAAAHVLRDSAFADIIGSTLGSTPSFADFMTAVGAGYSAVFTNSGRVADTIYMAPDRYGYLLGLTSAAWSQFVNVSGDAVGPLNVIVSRGMDAGAIVVGDSAGLLVAETDSAPVELRVVEPAIGGVEVGLIGAFKSVVVDPGSFAQITTAS
jgi:hypothetical protein